MAIPTLFLLITIAATLPPSIFLTMIIIGLTSWVGIARFTRNEFLKIRNLDYVTAAIALGVSNRRVMFQHILPNALAPVIISVVLGIAAAILLESSLSFLGIGVPADTVTWGSILNEARSNTFAWWLAIFPGAAIFITVLTYYLVGEGLRDALDPRLRGSR
jgi:peptide/nickel transport system permease protein